MTEGDASTQGAEGLVYVIDDDDAVRESVQFLLESAGIASRPYPSGDAFLEDLSPDMLGCLLLDVRMPGTSGLDLQKELAAQGFPLPVIVLTGHSDVPMAVSAMRAGAFDFLEKPYDDQILIDRVRAALTHERENRRKEAAREQVDDRLGTLTAREREVFGLVVDGFLNKQIAHKLEVSIKTIEVHRSRVMQKMQAESLAELVRMAMVAGL